MVKRGQNKGGLGVVGLILALGFVILVSLSAVCYGADSGRGEGGVVLPRHYPGKFTGIGRIDRVGEDEIVIDDSLYRLSGYTKYHTPRSQNASKSWFRVGSLVGFITNSNRKILSLWLIE